MGILDIQCWTFFFLFFFLLLEVQVENNEYCSQFPCSGKRIRPEI